MSLKCKVLVEDLMWPGDEIEIKPTFLFLNINCVPGALMSFISWNPQRNHRLREGKWLTQGHKESKWQSWDTDPGRFDFQARSHSFPHWWRSKWSLREGGGPWWSAPQGYLAPNLICKLPPLTLLLRNDNFSVQVSGTSRTCYRCYLDYLCDNQQVVV